MLRLTSGNLMIEVNVINLLFGGNLGGLKQHFESNQQFRNILQQEN